MNNLKLDNQGGLLAFQQVLAFMQDTYKSAVAAISKALGNNVIIDGCEVNGANLSPGIIILNGELLPFDGGANLGFFTVQETVQNRLYRDGVQKPLYHIRKAITHGSNGVAYSDFSRINNLRTTKDNIADLVAQLTALNAGVTNLSNSYAAHLSATNPHSVTKSQVGLSALPNAKSDSIDLDDSNTLATSKAVSEAWKNIVLYYGTLVINNIIGKGTFTVTHNINNSNYIVVGNFINNESSFITGAESLVYAIGNKTANSFKLYVDETEDVGQNGVEFHYILIRTN